MSDLAPQPSEGGRPPLGELFAQVREGLNAYYGFTPHMSYCANSIARPCDCGRDKLDERYRSSLEALSSIERHVQDMEKALRDFAEQGTRFDCNPTVMVHADNEEWMRIHSWWVGRAHDMDAGVRRHARAALPAREKGTE